MYKVYLADDEYMVIRGLERRVDWQKLNCRVVGSAQDGATALREILRLRPDILITDILMPEMDGLELIRRAGGQIDCAYIIFSGYSEFDYAKQALRLGTVDYLIKPVNIEEIEQSVMKAQERLEQSGLRALSAQTADQHAQMRMLRLLNGLADEAPELAEYSVFLPAVIGCGEAEAGALREALRELENPVCAVFFAMDKSALVLVAAAREEKDIVYFRKRLAAMMARLRRECAFRYWGMGFLCDSAGELAASHARANEMLDYCRFIGRQIGEEYAPSAYEPADYREWIRDIAALCVQEDEIREARSQVRSLLQSAVQRHLSVRAVGDLGRDLLYEMRQIFERALGEAAQRGAQEIFSAVRLDEIKSIGEMETCLNEKISEMRDFAAGQSLKLRQGQMEKIRAFIAQNLASPLTLSQIAQSVKMNPSYVSHVFKKETGDNLFEYIARARMERAKALLRTTDWKIARVSRAVGYDDQRYFCQVFKKQMGITATQYRCEAGEKGASSQK